MSINIGTDVSFWLMLLQVTIMIVLLVKLGFVIQGYVKAKEWKKYGRLVVWVIITVFVFVVLFMGYGPGRTDLQSVNGDEVGMTRLQEDAGPENIDSVRAITEESEPDVLKRQRDVGFDEEAKQADEYLKKLGIE